MDNQHPQVSDRRDFLQKLSAASAAAMAMGPPRLHAAVDEVEHPTATADSCILIWMAGGMAAPDTFDPKHYVPFAEGVAAKDIISTFPAIDTVVDDIKFTKGLENIAQVIDRGTIIRSAVQPDTRTHIALATSVSLAHGICSAADGGRASYRSLDRKASWTTQSSHPCLH